MSHAFSIDRAGPSARCRSLTTLTALVAWLGLWGVLQPTTATAQPSGIADDALPGLVHLPSALPAPYLAGSFQAGYAHTGAALDIDDSHDRMLVDGAVSLTPLSALSVGLRVGGHADWHSGEGSAGSEGFAASAALSVRGRMQVTPWFHLGLELQAALPAAQDAAHSLRALTPQAAAIVSGERARWMWSGNAGVRKNRQESGFGPRAFLNDYEALALANSDDWQALLGLGAALRIGPVTGLAEVNWKPLLGGDTPKLRYSPLSVTAGVRGTPLPWLQLGANVDVSLSPYPPPGRVRDVPVDPRFSMQGTIAFLWDRQRDRDTRHEPAAPPASPAPAPEPVATLSGSVAGPDGRPIRDATPSVSLVGEGTSREIAVDTTTGAFEGDAPEAGSWELHVAAAGYEPVVRVLSFPRQEVEPVVIAMDRVLPPGHVEVRVQDFRGRRVDASVVLLPERKSFEPAGEKGTFGLDLPPGKYTIEVVAKGYSPERRKAVVEENGVTIVVVDLRRRAER